MPPMLTDLSAAALAVAVKAKALEIGFDLAGIASADPAERGAVFRQWLAEGKAGEMSWLSKRVDERLDPAIYLPGARSVICVALNYHVALQEPASAATAGRVARYALGDDYHDVVKPRLHQLADWLASVSPGVKTRCGVDTAPIFERELAARAGIGWIGKNTCLIHPRVGSWTVLGEVVTTLALPADAAIDDHCGSCTRCIDACPTGAITEPYSLDARRCISYLTIEHRQEIEPSLGPLVGDWLFGCDVCQDVCPHNRQPPSAIDPSLRPRFPSGKLDAAEVKNWDEERYRSVLRHSAMKRVKLPVLKRNAQLVHHNATR